MTIVETIKKIEENYVKEKINAIKDYLKTTSEELKQRNTDLNQVHKIEDLYAAVEFDPNVSSTQFNGKSISLPRLIRNNIIDLQDKYKKELIKIKDKRKKIKDNPLTIEIIVDKNINSILLPIKHKEKDKFSLLMKELLKHYLNIAWKSNAVPFNQYVEIKSPTKFTKRRERKLNKKYTSDTFKDANIKIKVSYLDFDGLRDLLSVSHRSSTKDYFSVKETAKKLDLTEIGVRSLIYLGKIKSEKIKSKRLISNGALDKFKKQYKYQNGQWRKKSKKRIIEEKSLEKEISTVKKIADYLKKPVSNTFKKIKSGEIKVDKVPFGKKGFMFKTTTSNLDSYLLQEEQKNVGGIVSDMLKRKLSNPEIREKHDISIGKLAAIRRKLNRGDYDYI